MKRNLVLTLIIMVSSLFCKGKEKQSFEIFPINHASVVIKFDGHIIFVDPAANYEKLKLFSSPDLILITHAHGDHFNKELIDSLKNGSTIVIGNKKAINNLGYGISLSNGESKIIKSIPIEAIASYNITPESLHFHPKGEGNGYILTLGNERVYISGDTEDIPEMRNLKNIDYAFICMNMPYTLTPEKAASAVLDFKPEKVYPYHYRQQDGFSNIEKFKKMISVNPEIEVVFLDWYN